MIEGPEVKRGDSSAFVRQEDGKFAGGPCVILTVNKQPGTDTRQLTEHVTAALEELKASLPADIRIAPELYQQKKFIDLAIENVIAALRDGGILVAIILFLFLLNFRTTFITLTAIPLSIVVTGLVFKWFDMSINTMTLGGLAVAIGELVDDAIVDVENIFRRLRENRHSANPKPALLVVFQASAEIRNSIVFSTLIIVLVFIPLFALSGMEGRLFTPLGVAYIVSILASLVVSLDRHAGAVLLASAQFPRHPPREGELRAPRAEMAGGPGHRLQPADAEAGPGRRRGGGRRQRHRDVADAERLHAAVRRRRGAAQRAPAAGHVAPALQGGGRDGRAAVAEDPGRRGIRRPNRPGRTRRARHRRQHDRVHRQLRSQERPQPRGGARRHPRGDGRHPGIVTSVEQPLAHLISAMLSGVQAQVAIKLYGDDLDVLRAKVKEMQKIVAGVPGVKDLMPEPQISIPQLRIELNRDQLARYGLTPDDVNEFIETAMHGKVVSEVLQGQRTFDLFVRLDERYRENLEALSRLSLDLPEGGTTPLSSVATIYQAGGPNTINREQVRRRIVLQCNTAGRGLVDVVRDIQDAAQADPGSRCPPATSSSTAGSSRASSRPRG